MNRHEDLAEFIRDACRRKGVSLGEASQDLGHSRNWLERIVNKGIKRPRVESCKDIARYFGEDPNYVLQLAGYISPPPSPTPTVDEIVTIANLLNREDQLTLLEYARLLKFRATATESEELDFPDIPGIDWTKLNRPLARELASFISQEPATIPIWLEALTALPESAVELLLLNARTQVRLRNKLERDKAANILTRLARSIDK